MVAGLSPAPRIAPPVSPGQLAAAEAHLGFALPSLLRQIYLRVSNGGFGPGFWIYHPDPSERDRHNTLNGVGLLLHKTSLQEWIEAWVDGKNLWEEMERQR